MEELIPNYSESTDSPTHRAAGLETRSRILETALALMWAQSYGAVSVEDICREAGVKKGSFYHFFASKSKLTIEALDHESAQFSVVLKEILKGPLPVLKRFGKLCDLAFAVQKQKAEELGHVSGCPLCSVGSELSGNDEEVRKAILAFVDRPVKMYEELITEAIKNREIPKCDPTTKAREIQTFIAGSMFEARLRNNLDPLRQLESGIRALLGVQPLTKSDACSE